MIIDSNVPGSIPSENGFSLWNVSSIELTTRKLYEKFQAGKDGTPIDLFKALNEKFEIKNVFPQALTPTLLHLFFSKYYLRWFVQVDIKVFEDEVTHEFIRVNKEYNEKPSVRFYQQDYNQSFKGLSQEFDFVYLVCWSRDKTLPKEKYLLVCNDFHG